MASPTVSIIIPTLNCRDQLARLLNSIDRQSFRNFEVIVIDNASMDGSPDMVAAEFPQVVIERNNVNRGYAAGVNQGLRRSTGRSVRQLTTSPCKRFGESDAELRFDVGAGLGRSQRSTTGITKQIQHSYTVIPA